MPEQRQLAFRFMDDHETIEALGVPCEARRALRAGANGGRYTDRDFCSDTREVVARLGERAGGPVRLVLLIDEIDAPFGGAPGAVDAWLGPLLHLGPGELRIVAAGASLAAVTALAEEAQLPPSIRRTLAWTITRTPEAVPSFFGLRDRMWLGKPGLDQRTLDRWGIYAESLTNRVRTAMPPPAPWEHFGGRLDGGLLATQTPDLVLRMAQETARLKLPAQLVPGLLMYAAQDYWHDVDSRFPDDWPALTRQALALSPTRVEDYVAALAGGGPLRVK